MSKPNQINKHTNPDPIGGYIPNIYTSSDDENDKNKKVSLKRKNMESLDSDIASIKRKNIVPIKRRRKKRIIESSSDSDFSFTTNDNIVSHTKEDSSDDFIVDDDFIEYDNRTIEKAGIIYDSKEFYDKVDKIIDKENGQEDELLSLKNLTHKIANIAQERYDNINNDILDEELMINYNVDKKNRILKEYEAIKEQISKVPTVFDVLETNAGFRDKCVLMEQLDILIHLDPYTEAYMIKKNYLIDEIKKLKNTKMNNEKYVEIEKELLDVFNVNKSLKHRILESSMKKEQKAIIYSKYIQLEKMDSTCSNYHKLKEWIEHSLNIPFENKKINLPNVSDGNNIINIKLTDVQKLLDDKLYGMDNVKEEILLILNNKITNNDNTGNALALLGPPGTGKTCIIRALGQALNIPFAQISLGGTTDSSYLDGHGYTYEGATPGIIAKAIMQMKCNNGIIFFDEIDKLSESEKGKEVAWNLLHVTDFSQNNDFRDKYLCDISIDLSKIWFVYSMNNDAFMDKALRDRMPIIKVNGYSKKDKITIAKKYIVPQIMKNINMDISSVIFDDDVLTYIVSLSNNETSGVRELQKILNRILSKINLYKNIILENDSTGDLRLTFKIKKFKLPLVLTRDIVDELVKK